MSVVAEFDPRLCPLCGGDNACAQLACGGDDNNCWCRVQAFPQALLEKVPDLARNRACICQKCLQGAISK